MSLSHRYQDLSQIDLGLSAALAIQEEGLEELKLDSYEDGYKAGWDDSIKAQGAETEQALSMIAQRLEDISFTHAEATIKANAAMQPLLNKIVLSLLPNVARHNLSAHVQEQIATVLQDYGQGEIQIAVAPENLTQLQEQLEGKVPAQLKFSAEPTLTSGQVYLRASGAEREINLDAVQHGIIDAFDAFFAQTQQEEIGHG